MDLFNKEHIQTLFNLSPSVIPEKKEDFQRPNPPSFSIESDVPDVLHEFSDVIDTSIFRQPFSLRKYKNLVPKPPKKHYSVGRNIKQKKELKVECSKFGLYSNSPCSPSLSVDSAVDLSADQYYTALDESYSPMCTNNNFDVTVFDYPKTEKAETNKRTYFDNKLDITNPTKKKRIHPLEDIIIVPIPSCEMDGNPKSIFDILCSNLSYPIPIHIEKNSKYTTKDKENIFTKVPNQHLKPSLEGSCSSKSDLKCDGPDHRTFNFDEQDTSNSGKFTETLLNLVCNNTNQESHICHKEIDTDITLDLPEIFNESQKSEMIVLPENIAVRTAQFVVEDDEVPSKLFDILNSEDCENALCLSNQQDTSTYNFHTSLLNLFSSGIQRHNTDTKRHEKTKTQSKSNRCRKKKNNLICAQNVVRKYRFTREKNRRGLAFDFKVQKTN